MGQRLSAEFSSSAAQNALEAAFNRATLVAAAPVFAELIAVPGHSEAFVDSFLRRQVSGSIGSCQSKYSDWPDERFKLMQNADVSSAMRARVALWRTSL
jgi:hypothetical protein